MAGACRPVGESHWSCSSTASPSQPQRGRRSVRESDIGRGAAADVDRTVKAARGAFDSGVWSQGTPEKRKQVMLRDSPSSSASTATSWLSWIRSTSA